MKREKQGKNIYDASRKKKREEEKQLQKVLSRGICVYNEWHFSFVSVVFYFSHLYLMTSDFDQCIGSL